jgi:2'-5' RNA ligase
MSQRVFFALWPEPSWCEQLLEATAPLRAVGRWQGTTDLHVTLRFLGAVEPAPLANLRQATARVAWQPFSLEFDRVEWWPAAKALVALAAAPPAALRLVDGLAAAASEAGVGFDPKPFRPHITLARRAARAEALSLRPALSLAAETFCLACSEARAGGARACGARYRVLECWPAPRAS